MKLSRKLILLSVFTIVIPMLIVVIVSILLVYRTNTVTQWNYLETARDRIESDVRDTQRHYLIDAKSIATDSFIRDKVYFYSKYWDMTSDYIIGYDLLSFNDFIDKKALSGNIETIAVYRLDRKIERIYRYCSSVGPIDYLPETLYPEIEQESFGKTVFVRYPDGIFLRVTYPVFSDGLLVGLVVLTKGFNERYFSGYVDTFNVAVAVISKGVVLYNSIGDSNEILAGLVTRTGIGRRVTFNSSDQAYSAVLSHYDLSDTAVGDLVLYQERSDLLSQSGLGIQQLALLVLICITIPVVTFFIKETHLIRTINTLVDATNRISEGDYETFVPMRSKDEIGELNSNFNSMVRALKDQRDSLEAKNVELSLKNSYIDAVFQSLQINIIVVDRKGRIQVISRNASGNLESSDDQLGRIITETAPFNTRAKIIDQALQDVLADGGFRRLSSVQVGETSYEIDLYPVREENDEINAVVVILYNITEKMDMERALLKSARLASVGQFAAGLAHEVNNPLSIILNHLQLLESGDLSDEEQRRYMERMEGEIKRVSRLVNNLLRLSRETTSSVERMNPVLIVQELLQLFDPKLTRENDSPDEPARYILHYKNRSIRVIVEKPPESLHVSCTKDGLKQILLNVLKNAFQFCSFTNGVVRVGFELRDSGVGIAITDNGEGIHEKELEKVFEPFFTHHRTGTGLGLFLCRNLIHKIGGTIGIESNPGTGTTVHLFLPFEEVGDE